MSIVMNMLNLRDLWVMSGRMSSRIYRSEGQKRALGKKIK